MNKAFGDPRVSGWESLVEGIGLPEANDRHVLADAIRGRADVIVTENVGHFPASAPFLPGMKAVPLDEFLLTQFVWRGRCRSSAIRLARGAGLR